MKNWRTKILLMLGALGPGLIAGLSNNDAGGINTMTVLGSHYGYDFLWVLIVAVVVLAITQEMSARLGIITGKGLAGLIRENFGVRLTVLAMLCLTAANFGTLAANFAGIRAALEILGLAGYVKIILPAGALVIWLIIWKGSFKAAERIFLFISAFLILYIIAGFVSQPDWRAIGLAFFQPEFHLNRNYLLIFLAMIGTIVTPWGQFFIQSYAVDKGLTVKDYPYAKGEIYFSSVLSNIIGFFIIITAGNTLFRSGIRISDVSGAASALAPLAGSFAPYLFAFGLLGASVLAAFILPVTTAYAVCDSLGWESGFNHKWREAPWFYSVLTAMIASAAGFIWLFNRSLLRIIIITQAVNAMLLIVILVYLMKLMNNQKLLGQYKNKPLFNFAAWIVIFVLIMVTVVYFGLTYRGGEALQL